MDFGEKLKELREQNFLTQSRAAEILEMPLRTYQTWEYGTKIPAPYVQEAMLQKLGSNLEPEVFKKAAEFGKKLRGKITKMQLMHLQDFCEKQNREQFINLFIEICVGNDILVDIDAVQQIFDGRYEKAVMQGIVFGAISKE